jgi:pimeloyl-ACP methyl ester carboxylesterase
MAFAIPGAEWVVMPEASHALPAEYPDDAAALIQQFARATLAARE